MVTLFLVNVAADVVAGVVSYFIRKWLDKRTNSNRHSKR